jgi:predicted CopG family antitoxin
VSSLIPVMTNITLSIEERVYKRMRQHSEIKWSEFVRRAIKRRLDELDALEKRPDGESILTMLASEEVLREEWDNKSDERWDRV